MHDLMAVGVPVLAILFGVLWNNQGLRDLKGEIKEVRSEMLANFVRVETRLDRMQADLSQFYRNLGERGARLDNLEKR